MDGPDPAAPAIDRPGRPVTASTAGLNCSWFTRPQAGNGMEDNTDRNLTSDLETRRTDRSGGAGDHDACLVVISGARLGARIVPGNGSVVIGRDVGADFQISERSVSRRHCRVFLEDGRFWIEDLDSTNGTRVNGDFIDRAPLRDGDHVRVSETTLKFIAAGNIEANYHSELHESTIRDPLTGLFNRRHAMAVLETETARATRDENHRLSLALLDIDGFKPINDEYGHLVGDRVLKRLGELAQSRVRGGDTLARVGGEEFALLLPDTRRDEAWRMADDLRARIEAEPFEIGDYRLSITISGGVAEWQRDMRAPEDLLRQADRNLYRAKDRGRNRIVQRA